MTANWFDLICTLAQGMIVGCIVWLCFYYWVKSMAKENEGALRGLGKQGSPGDVAHRP